MNKSTLCLLLLALLALFVSPSTAAQQQHPLVSLAHTVRASLLDWMTNQADWFNATRTA